MSDENSLACQNCQDTTEPLYMTDDGKIRCLECLLAQMPKDDPMRPYYEQRRKEKSFKQSA